MKLQELIKEAKWIFRETRNMNEWANLAEFRTLVDISRTAEKMETGGLEYFQEYLTQIKITVN